MEKKTTKKHMASFLKKAQRVQGFAFEAGIEMNVDIVILKSQMSFTCWFHYKADGIKYTESFYIGDWSSLELNKREMVNIANFANRLGANIPLNVIQK